MLGHGHTDHLLTVESHSCAEFLLNAVLCVPLFYVLASLYCLTIPRYILGQTKKSFITPQDWHVKPTLITSPQEILSPSLTTRVHDYGNLEVVLIFIKSNILN
ncbi:hypothetical protein ACJX0J_017241, partial [Zea mays]